MPHRRASARILNWNLLHSLESTRVKKFSYCKPESLHIGHRMAAAVRYISDQSPGIACFQELDSSLMKLIERGLAPKLECAQYTLNESVPAKDGVGVFYDPEKFSVLGKQTVRFCNVLDKHIPDLGRLARTDKSALSLTRAMHREVREKLNMAVMVRLQCRDTNRELVACSSHLFWDPAYPDIKLIQAYLLAKELSEFASTTATVLGADLNSIPDSSAVYQLLSGTGTVSTFHPQHPVTLRSSRVSSHLVGVSEQAVPALSISPSFLSAFKTVNGTEPEFTNFTGSFKGCLDYVLVRNGVDVKSVVPLPSLEEVSTETALPNTSWPSDHLPLIADIEF